MKYWVFGICLGLLCSVSQAQTDSALNGRTIVQQYFVDTIQSSVLKETRIIKVYLPAGYSAANKYPVIYVLDENWMFEPTVNDVVKLVNFKVIPPCLVVGINSPNRSNDLRPDLTTGEFTATSKRFNDFLTKEVPEHLSRKYTSPVFSILVGHSDGATFAQNAMVNNASAFRGVVCLSQNLFGNELEQYVRYSKEDFANNHYYFVASGTRDAWSRLRSGQKLDSLFHLHNNPRLKVQHELYDADHSGIAGIGLSNGLRFIFSDYYQPNGWNGQLVDSLKRINTDPTVLIENTMARINNTYGIDAKPTRDGILDLAFVIITNKDQAASYLEYCRKNARIDEQFDASAAQLYEKIKEYDIALDYWTRYLNNPKSYKQNFFYFRRPMELLAYKMDKPEKAIDFAEAWEKAAPANVQLSFQFFIGKIAAEKNISRKKGKASIDYFIQHYDPAKTQYSLSDAEKIKSQLEGKKQ